MSMFKTPHKRKSTPDDKSSDPTPSHVARKSAPHGQSPGAVLCSPSSVPVVARKSKPPGAVSVSPGAVSVSPGAVSVSPGAVPVSPGSVPVSSPVPGMSSKIEGMMDRLAGIKPGSSRMRDDLDDEFENIEKNLSSTPSALSSIKKKNKAKNKTSSQNTEEKKIKWARSYSIRSVVEQICDVMEQEQLPMSSLSFTKEILDPMIADGRISDLTIPDTQEGRKKLRDRADKLKSAVTKIVSSFEEHLTLPEGVCDEEKVEVCHCITRIVEGNNKYKGRVRTVATSYQKDSGEYDCCCQNVVTVVTKSPP